MTTIPKNVQRGAELLDAQVPGWEGRLDPATLDLAHCTDCVLGQLFGNYDAGLEQLGIGHGNTPRRLGFSAWGAQRWENLTTGWLALLRRRAT